MAGEVPMEELRTATCELASLGIQAARRFFGKVGMTRKADDTPVTQADYAVQQVILTEIAKRYPGHAVVSEEQVNGPQRHATLALAEYCWAVDPIDGTRNFGRGASLYCTSVAVLDNGRPAAGAIADAAGGDVFSACRGGGAFENAKPLTLHDRPIDYNSILALSSFRRRPAPPMVRGWLENYLHRNLGSLCLHLVWVATGRVDAAYATECKLWDIAAGSLLIEEAGGIVTNPSGRPLWPKDLVAYRNEDIPILAGTPSMHNRLLDSVKNGGEQA